MCCASDTYAPGHLVDSVTASLCSQTWIIDTSEALQFNWEFGTQCWCSHCFNYAHNYPSQTPFDLPYMVKIYFSGSVPLLLPYFCRHYSSTENLGPSVGAHIASGMPTITHQRLLLTFPTWSKSTSVVLYLFCCHTSVDITNRDDKTLNTLVSCNLSLEVRPISQAQHCSLYSRQYCVTRQTK